MFFLFVVVVIGSKNDESVESKARVHKSISNSFIRPVDFYAGI